MWLTLSFFSSVWWLRRPFVHIFFLSFEMCVQHFVWIKLYFSFTEYYLSKCVFACNGFAYKNRLYSTIYFQRHFNIQIKCECTCWEHFVCSCVHYITHLHFSFWFYVKCLFCCCIFIRFSFYHHISMKVKRFQR